MITVKDVLNEELINRIKRVFPHDELYDYTIHRMVNTLSKINYTVGNPELNDPTTELEKLIDDIYEALDNYNKGDS